MRGISKILSGGLLGLVAFSSIAHAVTTIEVAGVRDDYEAQKRSSTGAYSVGEAVSAARCGFQSSFNGSGTFQPGGIMPVFFFQLPELNGAQITAATFSVGILPESSTSGIAPTFNGDLYALGFMNTIVKDIAEAQNFWYIGDAAQAALPLQQLNGAVTRLADNFLTGADFIPNGQPAATLPKSQDITAYIQALYAGAPGNGFTPGTSYLVIRISPDDDTPPTSGTQRWSLAWQGRVATETATEIEPSGTAATRPKIALIAGDPGCLDVPPVIISAAPAGATKVIVTGIDPNAQTINVYAKTGTDPERLVNAGGVGAVAQPPAMEVAIEAGALLDGDVILARQVVGGAEGCAPAASVVVGSCSASTQVRVPAIVEASLTSVPVTGVDPRAAEVRIYDVTTDTRIGTWTRDPGAGLTSTPATVSVALDAGQQLVQAHTVGARQVINGVVGCPPNARGVVMGALSFVRISDGFGDGDRDNDGILDNPDGVGTSSVVDDAADVGAKWYKAISSNHTVTVLHDGPAPKLGEDNSYRIDPTGTEGVAVANFPRVVLEKPGDGISVSMKVQFHEYPSQRDVFRFGLFNHAAGPLTSDQADTEAYANDPGYYGTINTGAAENTRRFAQAFDNSGGAGFFDLSETIDGASVPGVDDSNAHTVKLTLVRGDNGTPADLADDQLIGELQLDGQVIASGADTATNGGPYFEFNEIAFGAVGIGGSAAPYLHLSADDILVASSVMDCNNPVFKYDDNSAIDALDLAAFVGCLTGPSVPIAVIEGYCKCVDWDDDNDVDQDDFGAFQRCFTGSSGTLDDTCDD